MILYGAMFDLADVSKNGILCWNNYSIHLLRLLSITDCYSRETS